MLLAFLLMLGLTISAAATARFRLTPATILCGSWAGIFLLQSLFAPDMYSSGSATLVIFSISACFLLGELVGRDLVAGPYRTLPRSHSPLQERTSSARTQRNLGAIVILFGVSAILGMGLVWRALGLFESGGIEETFIAIGGLRAQFFLGDVEVPLPSRVGLLFAYSGVVLSLVYWFYFGLRWWLFLAPVAVLLFAIGTSGRAGLIVILLQWLFTRLLKDAGPSGLAWSTSLLLRGAVPIGIAAIAVFFLGQFLREGLMQLGEDAFVRVAEDLPKYLFGGVSAFAYYIDHLVNWTSLTYGQYSFSALFAALGIHPQAPGVYDQYVAISGEGELSNIYGAYRSFIDDFSILGACVIYLLSGVCLGAMYRSFISGNRRLVAVLIPLLSWLAFSPFLSLTYYNSFLLSVFLPYLIVRVVMKS